MATRYRRRRWILGISATLSVLVACGQLPGVSPPGAGGGSAGEAGFAAEEELTGSDGGSDGSSEAEGPTAGGAEAVDTGASGGFGGTTPEDRTGIYEDRIVVGVHAPVTGAAPIQSRAFEVGKSLYWRWLARKGQSVFGRTVEVKFRDDTYSPSVAAQRCQEMAEREPKAFLLIGGAGTDQITACARYAASRGIPFLSAGVTEEGVASYRSFFAISTTYHDQGPMLAQLLMRHPQFGSRNLDRISPGGLDNPDGTLKIAMVRADTPNFDDSETGFRRGLQQVGFDMDNFFLFKLPKEDSPTLRSAIAAAVQRMSQEGIDVVFPLIAPVVVIEFVEEAEARAYEPKYVGIGITTVNQVSNVLCQSGDSYDGASYFFPWPGWPEVMQGRFDPEYRQAVEAFPDAQEVNTVSGGGDIVLSLWATSRVLHQMFLQAGPDMTRQSFMQTLERGRPIQTPLYPSLRYGPSGGAHFGANQVYRLEVECDTDRAFHYRDGPVSGY
jgi:branched-chain amino acid transport system substrate-binding protein